MTRNQEIINGIIKRLERINVENGFSIDVKNVFDWIGRPAQDDEYPFLCVYDDEMENDDSMEIQTNTLDLKIVGGLSGFGNETSRVLRDFGDDILKAIYSDPKWMEQLELRKLKGISKLIKDEGGFLGEIVLRFKIVYHTERGSL